MTNATQDNRLSSPAAIRAEITRALTLSASLNNPTDHEIVAEYIAELEGAAANDETGEPAADPGHLWTFG